MIPLIWISTIVWVLLLVISVLRISKRKPLDAGWLRANLLILVAYGITAAVATQTAGNALWFAIFGEPYPGESLESLRFATLLGALVMISVTLVTVWDNLRTIPREKEEVLATQGKRIGQKISLPLEGQKIREHEGVKIGIVGIEQLLPLLKNFINHWEQYERLSQNEKWQSRTRTLLEASSASSELLRIDSQCSDSWNDELRNQVRILSDELRKFGTLGTNIVDFADWQSMEEKGKDAYIKAKALLLSLKAHTTS